MQGPLGAGLDRGVTRGRWMERTAAGQAMGAPPAPWTRPVSRRGWEAAFWRFGEAVTGRTTGIHGSSSATNFLVKKFGTVYSSS